MDEAVPTRKPTLGVKLMIGYFYFAQGFIMALSSTVPYTYANLPDYFTLGLFSLSILPFSLKFLTAPILQKHSNLSYGKRKTWLILSQVSSIMTITICSIFTAESEARLFAILLFGVYFGVSLQDIALDALALKELGSARVMSMMQAGWLTSGNIIGGVVLLKFTSAEFGAKIGLDSPITDLRTLLLTLSLFLTLPTILIHKYFTETNLQSDTKSPKTPLSQIYKIYTNFLNPNSRYCRIIIFMLLYNQGYNFFYAGYNYELIGRGFSRDVLNTVENFQHVFVTFLVFFLGTKANFLGFRGGFGVGLLCVGVVYWYLWLFFPTQIVEVIITNLLIGILSNWDFLLRTALCAYFPQTGTTGMLYTMNASAANLGRNYFLHTTILKYYSWRVVSLIGLILQLPLIIFFVPKMIELIEKGDTTTLLENSQEIQLGRNGGEEEIN